MKELEASFGRGFAPRPRFLSTYARTRKADEWRTSTLGARLDRVRPQDRGIIWIGFAYSSSTFTRAATPAWSDGHSPSGVRVLRSAPITAGRSSLEYRAIKYAQRVWRRKNRRRRRYESSTIPSRAWCGFGRGYSLSAFCTSVFERACLRFCSGLTTSVCISARWCAEHPASSCYLAEWKRLLAGVASPETGHWPFARGA
jgi:hypothetical protein